MDPFIISSIILSITFLYILIINNKLKSKVINISFLILSIIFLILIIIFDNNFIYEFLRTIITYLWYPSYLLFVITILFSIIILIYTLLKDKLKLLNKIINYILFSITFSSYIIYIRLDIDPMLYSSLYSKNSLILARIVTISFVVWIIINVILKIGGKYEK